MDRGTRVGSAWSPLAVVAVIVLASFGGCVHSTNDDSLRVHITSPVSTGSYTTPLASLAIGGSVGGYGPTDPVPTLTWQNDATGAQGMLAPAGGMFTTPAIALDRGTNTIRVRASNGVQDDATDSIDVLSLAP